MKKIITILIAISISNFGHGQINIKEKIKNKVNDRIEQKTDNAIDEALDEAEETAKNGIKKKTKTKTTDSTSKTKTKIKKGADDSDATAKKSLDEKKEDANSANAQFASYTKFDFVPGERIIFFEDYSQDHIGDFPVKWNTNGKGEVVTNNRYPGKWLKMIDGTTYLPEISAAKFPENYTIEYDLIFSGEGREGPFNLELTSLPDKKQVPSASDPTNKPGIFLQTVLNSNGLITYWVKTNSGNGYGDAGTGIEDNTIAGKYQDKFHVSIAVNKERFRYYVNQTKVLDLPRIMPQANYNAIIFRMWGWDNSPPFEALFSNLRFAEGTTDVRSKLITEGKLVTRGITFDVNSDKIKSESFGTLKEIATVLKDNPTVKVKIIGHTDSDGNASANLDLSKRRAASVKNSLSADFGIDASRMQTDGKGAAEPASPNTTPEGKANNRRVEFIKM